MMQARMVPCNLPDNRVREHGQWQVISNIVVCEKLGDSKILYVFVFKNHFRIIPADVAGADKNTVHQHGRCCSYKIEPICFYQFFNGNAHTAKILDNSD